MSNKNVKVKNETIPLGNGAIITGKRLSNDQFYLKHLSIINNFLPQQLTPKEIEVLAYFMALRGDIALDRFGTSARKIVRNKMNISLAGLANYLGSLKKKGFITSDMQILPILHPKDNIQEYLFKLVKTNTNGQQV